MESENKRSRRGLTRKSRVKKIKNLKHSAALVEAKVIVSPLQNLIAKRFPYSIEAATRTKIENF